MYVVVVTIHVKPEAREAFIAASRENAGNSRHEAGNLRFDVLEAEDDPHRFLLYEVYRTREDFHRHQQTAHYLAWKAAVAEWMAQPRVGLKYHSRFPTDDAWT
jgi:autoinducer 2-degrading protein